MNCASLTSIPPVIDVSIQSRQIELVSLVFLTDCPEKMFSVGDVMKHYCTQKTQYDQIADRRVLLFKGPVPQKTCQQFHTLNISVMW